MKQFFKRLFFIFTIHKSIPFVFRFFTAKDIPWKKRILFAVLIIGYAALPADFIPEWFLGIGLVDDVAIIALLLDIMKKQVPLNWEEDKKRTE